MKFTEPDEYEFVAYTPPQIVPGLDGESLNGAVQTYVKYYKGVKIKSITPGENDAGKSLDDKSIKTIRVQFDPASINLSKPIGANINPADPAVKVLRKAWENGDAVNVALESFRRTKTKDKQPVSLVAPIWALRGANAPGGKPTLDASGNNTSVVIAAVNGETTSECHSDASQWAALSHNKDGLLAPPGFKLITDKDDWSKMAVAVPMSNGSSADNGNSGQSIDIQALADLITSHLDNQLEADNRRWYSAAKEGEIGEGKPYQPYTSHKKISFGGYLSSRYRYAFEWAFDYLKRTTQSVPSDKDVMVLVDLTFDLSDQIQVKLYGGDVKPDRKVNSHTEIHRWVQWSIDNRFTYTKPSDEFSKEIVDYVLSLDNEIIERMKTVYPDISQEVSSSSSKANATAPQAQPQASAHITLEDKINKFKNAIDKINESWNDIEKLRSIYRYAAYLGLLDGGVVWDDTHVQMSPKSKAKGTLREMLTDRANKLEEKLVKDSEPKQVDSANDDPEPEPEDIEPSFDDSSEEPVESVGDEELDSDDPVPTDDSTASDDAVDFDDFARMLGADVEHDWSQELSKVVSSEQATDLWQQAKGGGMTSEVDYDGEKMPLSDAFNKLNEKLELAQEYAERIPEASSVGELNKIRQEAKKSGVLALMVEDGVSDEKVTLMDALKARLASIKGSPQK